MRSVFTGLFFDFFIQKKLNFLFFCLYFGCKISPHLLVEKYFFIVEARRVKRTKYFISIR